MNEDHFTPTLHARGPTACLATAVGTSLPAGNAETSAVGTPQSTTGSNPHRPANLR